MTLLTADRVRELLSYDINTGIFTWRVSRPGARTGSQAGWSDKGYWRISVDGQTYRAHRLAWLWVHGTWPGPELDHRNRVKNDNRLLNLREASRSENQQNRPLFKNNKSGFTGVSWHKQRSRWRGAFTVDKVTKEVGFFTTPEAAHEAVSQARQMAMKAEA